MIGLGFVIVLLAAIGIYCGILQILDALGIIDLDSPEYPCSDFWKRDSKEDDEIRMEGNEE